MHQILLSRRAERFLGELNADNKAKVIAALLALRKNPISGKELSGRLDGFRSLLISPFKIIFELQQYGEPVVFIIDILKIKDLC